MNPTQNQSPYLLNRAVSLPENRPAFEIATSHSCIFLTNYLHSHDPCMISKLSAIFDCVFIACNATPEPRVLEACFWIFYLQEKIDANNGH